MFLGKKKIQNPNIPFKALDDWPQCPRYTCPTTRLCLNFSNKQANPWECVHVAPALAGLNPSVPWLPDGPPHSLASAWTSVLSGVTHLIPHGWALPFEELLYLIFVTHPCMFLPLVHDL